jgi:hypothetical protein
MRRKSAEIEPILYLRKPDPSFGAPESDIHARCFPTETTESPKKWTIADIHNQITWRSGHQRVCYDANFGPRWAQFLKEGTETAKVFWDLSQTDLTYMRRKTADRRSSSQATVRHHFPPDHHLVVDSFNFKGGPNPNRRAPVPDARGSLAFAHFHPESIECKFDQPQFLRCPRTTIGERRPDLLPRIALGPGSYTPAQPPPPTKVFRKKSPPREVWTHLKREAHLPDPGHYWSDKPMWTKSVSNRTSWPARSFRLT